MGRDAFTILTLMAGIAPGICNQARRPFSLTPARLQLTRPGCGEAVQAVKKGWAAGSRAAAEAVPASLLDALTDVESIDGCIERLQAQEESGVDIHSVHIAAADNHEYEQMLKKLVG